MNRDYADIVKRLGPPLWWDEQAVPRYDTFHPELLGVYDTIVALIEIDCQGCAAILPVAATWNDFKQYIVPDIKDDPTLPTADDSGWVGFGDPPSHDCPGAGETMTTSVMRILEYWERPSLIDWVRRPDLEFDYRTEPM